MSHEQLPHYHTSTHAGAMAVLSPGWNSGPSFSMKELRASSSLVSLYTGPKGQRQKDPRDKGERLDTAHTLGRCPTHQTGGADESGVQVIFGLGFSLCLSELSYTTRRKTYYSCHGEVFSWKKNVCRVEANPTERAPGSWP